MAKKAKVYVSSQEVNEQKKKVERNRLKMLKEVLFAKLFFVMSFLILSAYNVFQTISLLFLQLTNVYLIDAL